jgi:hypothetical protein
MRLSRTTDCGRYTIQWHCRAPGSQLQGYGNLVTLVANSMLALPSSTLSLCAALRELESITWKELAAGYGCHQRLDEESVTSYHLMRLATAVPTVAIEKHHRGRESRTGADWEWWVGRPGEYLGFRVQAKILDPAAHAYNSLYSSTAKALFQVDKLIASAESAVGTTFPIYVFYNYWLRGAPHTPSWPCPRPTAALPSAGWTVMSAYQLRDRLMSWPTKKLWRLSTMMFPISCLFCCDCHRFPTDARGLARAGVDEPDAQSRGLARAVADAAIARWGLQHRPVVVEQAPVYVERMYKGEEASDGWRGNLAVLRPRSRELPRGVSRVLLTRDL